MTVKKQLNNIAEASPQVYLSQIFYPLEQFQNICEQHYTLETENMYLIGWNLDNFRCCIACVLILREHQSVEDVEACMKASTKELEDFLSSSLVPTPMILGRLFIESNNSIINDRFIPDPAHQGASIWITMVCADKSARPRLHSVYSLGSVYHTSTYLIGYHEVNTNRLEVMSSASLIEITSPVSPTVVDINVIVAQINCSYELKSSMSKHLNQSSAELSLRSEMSISSFPLTVVSCQIFDAIASFIVRVLESKALFSWWSLGQLLAHWVGLRGNDGIDPHIINVSLCDLSLTAVHLRERLILLKIVYYQTLMLIQAWKTTSAARRTSLWRDNARILILVFIDITLGLVTSIYLARNQNQIMTYMYHLCKVLEDKYVKQMILWFNNNPGGVKLNPVITRRIGTALLWVIKNFESLVSKRLLILHSVGFGFIICIGFIAGVSVQLMVLMDITRLVTLHIAILHRFFGYQYQFHLELIYSLYYLFYGKKNNILRHRIDTCEYDHYQLLFGIALFAMAIFLFPTFAAYFYLFAILHLIVVLFNYVAWIFIVCLKEFPYVIHLEVLTSVASKAPRKSDGIRFQLLEVERDSLHSKVSNEETQMEVKQVTKVVKVAVPLPPSALRKPSVDTTGPTSVKRKISIQENVEYVTEATRTVDDGSVPYINDVSREDYKSWKSFGHKLRRGNEDFVLGMFQSTKISLTSSEPDLNSFDDVDDDCDDDESEEDISEPDPTQPEPPTVDYSNVNKTKTFHHTASSLRSDRENFGSTIFFELSQKSFSLSQFYLPYEHYWNYFVIEKGLMWRIFRGILQDRPSLEIQLVRATTNLSSITRRPFGFDITVLRLRGSVEAPMSLGEVHWCDIDCQAVTQATEFGPNMHWRCRFMYVIVWTTLTISWLLIIISLGIFMDVIGITQILKQIYSSTVQQ